MSLERIRDMKVERGADGDIQAITLKTNKRIPYEVTGTLKEIRDELKLNLKKMTNTGGKILVAEYISKLPIKGADVENLLFYNIGSAAFENSATAGIRFTSSLASASDGGEWEHCYRYFFEIGGKTIGEEMLSFLLPSMSENTKASEVWWAVSKAIEGKASLGKMIPDGFRLSIEVHTPEDKPIKLASCMKPLLDGLISALQYSESIDPIALKILAASIGEPFDAVKAELENQKNKLLGNQKKLVFAYREGIKWNPADDRLKECTISINRTSPKVIGVKVRIDRIS